MSHVDEGKIHAWLDGAYPPGDPEGAEIEAHLDGCAECRTAVEEANRLRDRASYVLRNMAPDAVRVEPFERIVEARRARRAQDRLDAARSAVPGDPASTDKPAEAVEKSSSTAPRKSAKRGNSMRFAWAASIMLAVTAGWLARETLGPGFARPGSDEDMQSAVVEAPSAPQPDAMAASEDESAQPPRGARQRNEQAVSVPVETGGAADDRQRGAGNQAGQEANARPPERTEAEQREVQSAVAQPGDPTANRRTDTLGAAAAIINIPPPPAAAKKVAEAGRLLDMRAADEWVEISIEQASAVLGRDPFAIEGIAISSVQRLVSDTATVLRVRQDLGDGVSVEIMQRKAAIALDEIVVTGVQEQQARVAGAARDRRTTAADTTKVAAAETARIAAVDTAGIAAVARTVPADLLSLARENTSAIAVPRIGYTIVMRGPLSADSLRTLANRVR